MAIRCITKYVTSDGAEYATRAGAEEAEASLELANLLRSSGYCVTLEDARGLAFWLTQKFDLIPKQRAVLSPHAPTAIVEP